MANPKDLDLSVTPNLSRAPVSDNPEVGLSEGPKCCCIVTRHVFFTVTSSPTGGDYLYEQHDSTGCKPCLPPEQLDVFGNPIGYSDLTITDNGGGKKTYTYYSHYRNICGMCDCYSGDYNPGECIKHVQETENWVGNGAEGANKSKMPDWVVETLCELNCPKYTGTKVPDSATSHRFRIDMALQDKIGPSYPGMPPCKSAQKCCNGIKKKDTTTTTAQKGTKLSTFITNLLKDN